MLNIEGLMHVIVRQFIQNAFRCKQIYLLRGQIASLKDNMSRHVDTMDKIDRQFDCEMATLEGYCKDLTSQLGHYRSLVNELSSRLALGQDTG